MAERSGAAALHGDHTDRAAGRSRPSETLGTAALRGFDLASDDRISRTVVSDVSRGRAEPVSDETLSDETLTGDTVHPPHDRSSLRGTRRARHEPLEKTGL